MIISHSGLTAGYITGLSFLIVCVIAIVASFLLMWFRPGEYEGGLIAGVCLLLGSLIGIGLTLGASWPTTDTSYHRFYQVEGTVQEVTYRQFDTRYAVQLKESGQIFGCDDTRCSALKPGDHVALNCKKEWQYQAVAGWACRWNQP